jgi:hypothetical protein
MTFSPSESHTPHNAASLRFTCTIKEGCRRAGSEGEKSEIESKREQVSSDIPILQLTSKGERDGAAP